MKTGTLKKIAVWILLMAMIMSLAACGKSNESEITKAIRVGQVVSPNLGGSVVTPESAVRTTWIPLDQLKTYRDSGFRVDFDDIFYINITTSGNRISKQGCLFVVPTENGDAHNGNSTFMDAARNEVFNRYVNETERYNNLISEVVKKAYSDVDGVSTDASFACYNAYFGLLSETNEQDKFNGDKVLTREQFYTMLYKATHEVSQLSNKYKNDPLAISLNAKYPVEYTMELLPYNYLSLSDGSLNSDNISKPISKLEVVYMIMNLLFSDKLEGLTMQNDATALGYKYNPRFMTDSGINSISSDGINHQNMLGHMLVSPDEGIEEEMMKSIGLAASVGLFNGVNTNLTSSITKLDAIKLIWNAFQGQNKVYGYATTQDYPTLVIPDNLDLFELDTTYEDILPQVIEEQTQENETENTDDSGENTDDSGENTEETESEATSEASDGQSENQ